MIVDYWDIQGYIDTLLEEKESSDIEFKDGSGGFPGSFWDTYSAFANTDGGVIVLGIKEKRGVFSVSNLTVVQVEKYQQDFWNSVNNKSTVNCNIMKNDDVIVADYCEHKIMLFYVPRADRSQRPIFRTQSPYNGTFKRNFEGDYKCNEKEVHNMLKELCENDFLKSIGTGRGTKYHLFRKSSINVATSDSNVATSDSNVATSDSNVATSGKNKMNRDELYRLIVCKCNDYASLDEIAKEVNRQPQYLKNHILPKMMAEVLIEFLYPKKPNHPNQKYRKI